MNKEGYSYMDESFSWQKTSHQRFCMDDDDDDGILKVHKIVVE